MKLLLTSFLTFCFCWVNAQTIPSGRLADWSHAGYPDSIPSPSLILDVTQFGALGDGVTDDVVAIRAAIDSLHGTRGVIYFPAGNYLVSMSLDLPDSVIIRGTSADSTKLTFNLGGLVANCFNIGGNASATTTPVVFGADRGSTAIVVVDPTTFSAGDYAELIENNGAWDTDPIFWADNSVGQILHLTNVSGDTLFFDSPLRINYDTALNVRVKKVSPRHEVGIECMEISRADNVAAGVCYNIFYNYAANCWIRGIESSLSIGSHVEMDASTNISIRGSHFHHSNLYDGVSTHGYGITLFAHTGQCLIENNIMQHLRHAFSLQTGANGNVISYNYCRESTRSEFPTDYGADLSLHGHFPYSNLFEGNIVSNIGVDQAHGPNGPFNTFFRNRADLYGIIVSSGTVQNDSINFVGNEVTNMTFGQYMLFGSGHFEFGNNIKGTITPAGTTPLPDSSCYLTTYPNFWTNFTFPSLGIPNTLGVGSNPAKDRFLSGSGFTSCDDDITIAVKEIEKMEIEVYPNPAATRISFQVQQEINNFVAVLKDQNGKIISKNFYSEINSDCVFNFPEQISDGIYLLEIIANEKMFVKKIVIIK